MRFTFVFSAGPLDGSGFHFDTDYPQSLDAEFGGKAYLDTVGGQVGRQFTVSNPFTPADDQGTVWQFSKHIYQVTNRRIVEVDRYIVAATHVCAVTDSPGRFPLPITEYIHSSTGEKFAIEAFPLGTGKWGALIHSNGSAFVVLSEPHATKDHGSIVQFDSFSEAVKSAEQYIQQDFLRD